MKRYRLPSAFAVCSALGLTGSLAVTACGSVTQTGRQTGAPATHQAGNASSRPSAAAPSPPAGPGATAPSSAAASSTVLLNCLHHAQVEPASFVLTCADGNSYLAQLSWKSWTPEQAVATGVHELNDCTPYCAAGKFHGYPVVITFWRSEPVAGHPGERSFTKVTVRYTGPRPSAYTNNGKLVRNPAAWTQSLGTSTPVIRN